MNREFLLNIIFLVFINLLIKPFFIFGIDLTVQNRVPDGDYGLYFTLFNFTYLFQILNDFGIQNFNNRNISQHPQLLPKYFPNLLLLKGLLGILYFVLTALVAWGLVGYGPRAMGLLAILLGNQVLTQIIFFLRSNVSGLGYYRIDSLLSSLDKLLMLFTCSLVLWANPFAMPFSVELFALAQTAALLATAVTAYLVLRSKARFPVRPSWLGNWRSGRLALLFLLKKSYPFALVILLMTAYTRLDAVILERMLPDGTKHADVYAGAYRLLDACNMLGYLFASLLLPMFARLLRHHPDGSTVRPLVSLSFKMIWAGSLTLVAAVFFARQPLVELMMPAKASAYRWDVLGVLIWTFIPVSVTYIFSTLLTAHERLMQMNRFFVGGLIVDVLLNVLLIPRWQALGCAVATLGTQLFIAVAMVVLCVRTFGFRPSWRGLLQVAGFAVALFLADWLIFEKTGFSWKMQFGLALLAGAIGFLGSGMLKIKTLELFTKAR